MAAPAASPAASSEPAAARPTSRARGFRHYRRFQAQLRIAGRVAFGLGALWLAVGIRAQLPDARGPISAPTILACLATLLLAVLLGAVEPRARHTDTAPRALTLVPAAAVAVLIVLFFLRSLGTVVSRPTILFFALLATALLAIGDVTLERLLPRAAQVRNLILVGGEGGLLGAALDRELDSGPWRVAARLGTSTVTSEGTQAALGRLRELVRREPIDEVLIADSIWEAGPDARDFFRGVSELCEQTGTRLHLHAQWLSSYRRVQMDYLGDHPIMTFSFSGASPWLLMLKRGADLALSASLLAALSPLLAVLAVVVRLDSPGPALFRQARCGLRGRQFTIYKFRTMVADAEARKASLRAENELSGPVFKLACDPRITRVGRWLRKSSLDELPQLWNVLRGEMSLIGPRPPLPDEVREYHLGSLHRLAMKPGMTGLWQVSGRSAIRDFDVWVELDSRYIRHWSLWLDCKILARTLGVLFRMNGQ